LTGVSIVKISPVIFKITIENYFLWFTVSLTV